MKVYFFFVYKINLLFLTGNLMFSPFSWSSNILFKFTRVILFPLLIYLLTLYLNHSPSPSPPSPILQIPPPILPHLLREGSVPHVYQLFLANQILQTKNILSHWGLTEETQLEEEEPMAGNRVIDSPHHTHTIVRGSSWRSSCTPVTTV